MTTLFYREKAKAVSGSQHMLPHRQHPINENLIKMQVPNPYPRLSESGAPRVGPAICVLISPGGDSDAC